MRINKGFTLIELLVVVAIIGILAAIALPKLFGAICTSKIGQVDGVMGSVNAALAMYYGNNTVYPTAASSTEVGSFITTTYMATTPVSPWGTAGTGDYKYASTGAGVAGINYTLCVSINNGVGCDGTTAGTDNYRYYASASGKVGNQATTANGVCN